MRMVPEIHYTTVGASLLINEMLLRQNLRTNTGHDGFMMTCSTTIRSSVKRVLKMGGGEINNALILQ